MGYDLHIVRTEDWFDANTNPITKEEVNQTVASASDLSWSSTDFIELMNEDGSNSRYYAINWEESPVFIWIKYEIKCSNPSNDQIIRMVELANQLNAHVVGDDGEKYLIKKGFFGKKKLIQLEG